MKNTKDVALEKLLVSIATITNNPFSGLHFIFPWDQMIYVYDEGICSHGADFEGISLIVQKPLYAAYDQADAW